MFDLSVYNTVSQKTCDYIFYNNFNNRCPITIIFGIVSSKSMNHRYCRKCSHMFFGDTVYICTFSTLILFLGLLTCKNRLPYVGGDVKHCSIQSNSDYVSLLASFRRVLRYV